MMVVIGSGVAGLTAARAAYDAGGEVLLMTAGALTGGERASAEATSTGMAQGGIAAALGDADTPAAHLRDTITAGAGLVDEEAARVLVTEGVTSVRRLLASGFAADRDALGEPLMGLEAAHGAARIVHAGGDRTGARLHEHLVSQLPSGVRVLEHARLQQLHVSHGKLVGVSVEMFPGDSRFVAADTVVLATGGYAALYAHTSNHAGARGTGLVAAAEAGALVADLEFVQFHPTVLAGTGQLISEVVRGAGAILLDGSGERFMLQRHPEAELAPRDVVSREVHRVMRERNDEHVWLDARPIEIEHGAGSLARKFPGISAALQTHGYDWTREPVPVTPAAHYTMGGVASDLDGRSSVPGLFVAGEVASTGVHGANRLASNSLLEGLVFGERAGRAAAVYAGVLSTSTGLAGDSEAAAHWKFSGDEMPRLLAQATVVGSGSQRAGAGAGAAAHPDAPEVSITLSQYLGIERNRSEMIEAQTVFDSLAGSDATLARLITAAALAREESRGAHRRADHPDPDDRSARRRAFALAAVETAGAPGAAAQRSGAQESSTTSTFSTTHRSMASC